MTTREFIMHLLMNCEMDDPVVIEVKWSDNRFKQFAPKHVTCLGDDYGDPETLIECTPIPREE